MTLANVIRVLTMACKIIFVPTDIIYFLEKAEIFVEPIIFALFSFLLLFFFLIRILSYNDTVINKYCLVTFIVTSCRSQ